MAESTMKAVHYGGLFKVSVTEVDLPKIEHPDDVIIKVTTSCTSVYIHTPQYLTKQASAAPTYTCIKAAPPQNKA